MGEEKRGSGRAEREKLGEGKERTGGGKIGILREEKEGKGRKRRKGRREGEKRRRLEALSLLVDVVCLVFEMCSLSKISLTLWNFIYSLLLWCSSC